MQDYNDTYSRVVSINVLWTILALVTKEKRTIITFDIKATFLYGKIEEGIYLNIPEGYEEESNKIYELQKVIYGLSFLEPEIYKFYNVQES